MKLGLLALEASAVAAIIALLQRQGVPLTRVAAYADLVQGLMDAGVAVVGSVLNEVPVKKKKLK